MRLFVRRVMLLRGSTYIHYIYIYTYLRGIITHFQKPLELKILINSTVIKFSFVYFAQILLTGSGFCASVYIFYFGYTSIITPHTCIIIYVITRTQTLFISIITINNYIRQVFQTELSNAVRLKLTCMCI